MGKFYGDRRSCEICGDKRGSFPNYGALIQHYKAKHPSVPIPGRYEYLYRKVLL